MEIMSYLFMTIAFKLNKYDTTYLKLDDAPWDNQNKTHNQDKFGLFHKWPSK